MKSAFPVILMSVGALIAFGFLGITIGRNVGLADRSAGGDLAVLAWASMFAMPIGMLLMLAGFILRRAEKSQNQAAAARKAQREAERTAMRRPTHSD
jgi:hypothetical protein